MNPSLAAPMVAERHRDLESLARGARTGRRRGRSIVRALGLGLILAGRRLVGPDELADLAGLRGVSSRPSM